MSPRPVSKPFLGIAILAERGVDAKALVRTINSTRIARVVFFSHIRLPQILTPSALEGIRDSRSKIVVVAAHPVDHAPMIKVVNLLSESTVGVNVLAYGDMDNPMTIVEAMRFGARDYLHRGITALEMAEAIERLYEPPPDEGIASSLSPLPPDSGPSGSPEPPEGVLVGVRRPRGPKTLPPRTAVPDFSAVYLPI